MRPVFAAKQNVSISDDMALPMLEQSDQPLGNVGNQPRQLLKKVHITAYSSPAIIQCANFAARLISMWMVVPKTDWLFVTEPGHT